MNFANAATTSHFRTSQLFKNLRIELFFQTALPTLSKLSLFRFLYLLVDMASSHDSSGMHMRTFRAMFP